MGESSRQPSVARAQQVSRVGDATLIILAAAAAAIDDGVHWGVAACMLAMATVLWLLAARTLGQYRTDNGRGLLGDVALTLVMFTAVVVPAFALARVLRSEGIALHPARFLAALLPAVALRACTVGVQLWRSRPGLEVLVVGIGPLGRLTGAELGEARTRRRVLGYLRFEDETPHSRLRAPLLGSAGDLEATLRRRVVDEVYLASTATEHAGTIQAAIRTCETLGIPFALPVCAYRLARARLAIGSASVDGYTHFLTVKVKRIQRLLKRLLDIAASAAALAVLSPLLLATAALVTLTSPGPVLFRQRRVGLHGRTFDMLKFRSMIVDAERLKADLAADNEQSGPVFKMKHDPRVTAFGRFMRRHSLDELPQLVNVLRGDMSIVGPRPPLPEEVARYEAWQLRRLSVRPGLTCVWQVSGRNEISFRDWMLLDMRYIDHWSLALDLDLIWKTVPVVLTGRGAS